MSMRDEFERLFPVPKDVEWTGFGYAPTKYSADQGYNRMWKVWQAARAQGGQGAEPVVDIGTQEREGFWQQPIDKYTQPAQHGSVPEDKAINLCHWLYRTGFVNGEKGQGYDPENREAFRYCLDAMTATTPKPEGDGWLILPGDANNHRCLLYTPSEQAGSEYRIVPAGFVKMVSDATHYMPLKPPTDLKRPDTPKE